VDGESDGEARVWVVSWKSFSIYYRKTFLMKFDQATKIWREIEVGLLKQEFLNKGVSFVKVLDLGCGEGEIAKEVFGGNCNKGQSFVTGLDNDKEMVRKARESGVYNKVILGDAGKMDLKDGEVDLVFSNSVLEHISHLEKVLKEVSRVLKPGGLLIATMPSHKLGEYIGWGRLYSFLFNKKYDHYHLYSKEKWGKLLKEAGLELVDSYYYLDKATIRAWHKCLWIDRLGFNKGVSFVKEKEYKRLGEGAGIAIKAKKVRRGTR